MQDYEIAIIGENIPYNDRQGWEQTRFLAFANVQKSVKKKLSATDLITFPWENEGTTEENKEDTNITNNEIERLKEKANLISKLIQNTNGK